MRHLSALSRLTKPSVILLVMVLTACSRAATTTPIFITTSPDTVIPTNAPASTDTPKPPNTSEPVVTTPNPTRTPLPQITTLVWTSTGLEGKRIVALAVDPTMTTTLYVGTDRGDVLKSTNGGASWTAVSTGLTNDRISALVIDPATPTTLYAGTDDGVFKSTNGGARWTAVSTGLANDYITALVIDPATPATLYAVTDDGVFKSTNGGANWSNIGPTKTWVSALAIDPATPTTLYAGTVGGGVLKSADGGANWSAVNTGLPVMLDTSCCIIRASWVFALVIDPVMSTTLYAGTNSGVFKSTNGGANWNAVNTGLTNANVSVLAIDPATPTTLYAQTNDGVFQSTNGGSNWSNADMTDAYVAILAINPAASAILYSARLSTVTSISIRTYDECDDGPQQLMNLCYSERASAVKSLLSRLIEELRSHMTVLGEFEQSRAVQLLAVQEEWIKYRDAHCQWEASEYEGGSIQPTVRATCEIALTWDRIDELKGYLCEIPFQPCDESQRYDDLPFRIQAVRDGDDASQGGDYAQALALYQQAIFDENLVGSRCSAEAFACPDPNERPRMSAYSRYRIVLLHVIQGHSSDARTVYETLQSQFPASTVGHPYAELATAFWNEYQSSQNIAAACGRAIDYASEHMDDVLTPLGSFVNGEDYPDYAPEDVCPFD